MSSEVDQALQRARMHLRNSMLEGLEGLRALLEAVAHASGQTSASTDSLIGQIQTQIEDLISMVRDRASFVLPKIVLLPLNEAVETEIKRWQERAKHDPDARLVLRAFLGMRELIWEFSHPRGGADGPAETRTKRTPKKPAEPTRNRVQRFDIEDG
jgi:hypothetical protein